MNAPANPEAEARVERAFSEFTDRWVKALFCLKATDQPQWKRVQNALFCFKGLPLDDLPRKFQRRIERHFARVNAVLARYTLKTWDDYQKMSAEDLTEIERLIDAMVGGD